MQEKAKAPPIVPVPAVNGVVFDASKRILLTRRSKHIREPGKWCIPGGHLDGGEDWTTAFRREMQEELGIVILRHRLIGIYSDPKLTVTPDLLPEGHYGQFVVAVFLVDQYEGEITPNDEVDGWDWFPQERLPQPIVRSHPVRIVDAHNFAGEVFVR